MNTHSKTMSNLAEIEIERKFQEDIAKATALSIESQALDEYRRKRLHSSYLDYTNSTDGPSFSQDTRYESRRPGSFNLSTDTPPPIPLSSHRRHSVNSGASVRLPPQGSAEISSADSDLISFSSPTPKKPELSTYEKIIEDIQKLNSQIVQYQPGQLVHNPSYVASVPVYAHPSQFYSAASGLQLVPFVPQQQPQQKASLTNEDLQKLYNMPHQQNMPQARYQTYPSAGFIRQYTPTFQYPQNASAASTVTGYHQHPYGYPYNASSQPFSHMTNQQTFAAPQSTSTDIPAQQVTNPNSALVLKTRASNSIDNTGVSTFSRHIHNGASSLVVPSNAGSVVERRKTPPIKKNSIAGDDLIDLRQSDE